MRLLLILAFVACEREPARLPTPAPSVPKEDSRPSISPAARTIAAGSGVVCMLSQAGEVYCFGVAHREYKARHTGRTNGQRHRVSFRPRYGPIPFATNKFVKPSEAIRVADIRGATQLAVGDQRACAVAHTRVLCWRDDKTIAHEFPSQVIHIDEGARCVTLANGDVHCGDAWQKIEAPKAKQASYRFDRVCVVATDDSAYCATTPDGPVTTRVASGPILSMTANYFICTLNAGGEVWCAHGIGGTQQKVELPRAEALAAGPNSSVCASLANRQTWCFGYAAAELVSDVSRNDGLTPFELKFDGNITPKALAIGRGVGCATTEDGSAYCFGHAIGAAKPKKVQLPFPLPRR